MFYNHFGHATNFRKFATVPYYVKWMTNELIIKVWVLSRTLDEVRHFQSWEGPNEVIMEDFPYFIVKKVLLILYLGYFVARNAS